MIAILVRYVSVAHGETFALGHMNFAPFAFAQQILKIEPKYELKWKKTLFSYKSQETNHKNTYKNKTYKEKKK